MWDFKVYTALHCIKIPPYSLNTQNRFGAGKDCHRVAFFLRYHGSNQLSKTKIVVWSGISSCIPLSSVVEYHHFALMSQKCFEAGKDCHRVAIFLFYDGINQLSKLYWAEEVRSHSIFRSTMYLNTNIRDMCHNSTMYLNTNIRDICHKSFLRPANLCPLNIWVKSFESNLSP